jgi:transposase, IS5 family
LKQRYRSLLNTTSRAVGQAKRFSAEIGEGVKRATGVSKQLALEGMRAQLGEMVLLVGQVMKQTRARIFRGNALICWTSRRSVLTLAHLSITRW